MLSRVSWRNATKVSVGCLAVPGILFLVFCAIYYYGPDKHEVTKHARTEWSRKFREVGLSDVPEHAKYAGGVSVYKNFGDWNFRVDGPTMRQWLSRSQSLRTAEVRAKPSKKAYLFYAPAAHRACLVMVFFAPHWNPPMADGEALAQVHTIDIGAKKSSATARTRAVKDALETLAGWRDSDEQWVRN